MTSRVGLAVLVFAALVTAACASGDQATPSGETNGDAQKGTREGSDPVSQEPTTKQDDREVLTGVITDKDKSSCPEGPCTHVLVEEDPGADCGGRSGPLEPGCEKMYFDVTGKTDVFQKKGNTRKAMPSAAVLQEGLRVRADYTGYDVATSYPAQTGARAVTILGSR